MWQHASSRIVRNVRRMLANRSRRTSRAGSQIVHDATRAGLTYNTSRELSQRAYVWFATFFLTSTVQQWPTP